MEMRPRSIRPAAGEAAPAAAGAAISLRRMLAFTRASSSRMEKGFVI